MNKILTYHQQDVQKVISFFPGKTITVSLVDDLINRALPDIKAENFHEEVKQLASRLKMDEKVNQRTFVCIPNFCNDVDNAFSNVWNVVNHCYVLRMDSVLAD